MSTHAVGGYAVVDVQTTGLEPSRHHRILEIAVVHVADDGTRNGSWCTLVNPQRDVGATDLHGIAARDVLGAPTFEELVPRVLDSLTGRTLVAHNAEFEASFLDAELRRSGVPLPPSPPIGVPTMAWFGLLSGRRRRRLIDCCQEIGIPLAQRYSSQHQADAVAELLHRYLDKTDGQPPWTDVLGGSRSYLWPRLTSTEPGCGLLPRSHEVRAPETTWLDRIISMMPSGGERQVDAYLDVLEMALLDRYLSAHEIDSLVSVAARLALDRDMVQQLHEDYMAAMAKVAWEDGVVSDSEHHDLVRVSELLGLPEHSVEGALARAQTNAEAHDPSTQFALQRGDSVCFTGTMAKPRDVLENEARAHGLVVSGLTKNTRLLVAADPDSLSGKAKKARDYGIPVVNEAGFHLLLNPQATH